MKSSRFLRALPLALTLLATPVRAEQSTIVGPVVGPHTMADVMGTINASFLAIQSCNSGSSAPANGVGGLSTHFQCWADTTTNPVVFKRWDGASWVTIGKMDTTAHIWTGSYQGTDQGNASTATLGTSGHTIPFLDGTNLWSGVNSFNSSDFVLKGATSGTTTVNSAAVAGSSVITLPAATDTLVGKATTDVLTNKTLDTAATGNSFSINGLAATANTGTGSVVRATSPTIAGPTFTGTVTASVGNFSSTLSSAANTITSNSALSLAVGANGATNPVFQVDDSIASQAAGIKITGNATGAGASIAAIDSGANTALSINAKGTGGILIGNASTGAVTISPATTLSNALTYGGVTLSNAVTGTGNMVLSAGPTFTGTVSASVGAFSSTLSSTAHTITSASANALAVGLNGATNPAFDVDASTASQAAGVKVTGAATGGTVAISAIDSGANTNLTLSAKGTGTIGIGSSSTGAVTISPATTLSNALTYGGVTLSNSATGTGSLVLSANPTITGSFTATGLVTFADMATAAIATGSQYLAGTSNELVQSGTIYQGETTTTFGATTTFDFSTFINTAVTLTANITTQTLTNVTAGKSGSIAFIQDGTGSRTTVWNSIFKFAGGVTPTLTTTAGAIDVLFYSCRSATNCPASLGKDFR